MKYLIPKEAAEKWGISVRRVQLLCRQGRISGAERHGRIWLIPENAEKPEDARIRSGRYIKSGTEAVTATAETTATTSTPRKEAEKYPFLMPTVSHAIIPRPRLKEKIAPPGSSLTYIHADAGYGKTTLLAQYAGERDDTVWLSLDERDVDMAYFLRHLENAFPQEATPLRILRHRPATLRNRRHFYTKGAVSAAQRHRLPKACPHPG